jgi:xylulokinase
MDAVTVGLDIGTTSIKAVAVDGDGRVLRRSRISHPVLVPEPHMMEHDAARAWQRGPKRALASLGPLAPAGVAVTSMVPSLTAVDRRGRPLTPGLLYGDRRASSGAPAPGPAGEIVEGGAEIEGFLRWTSHAAPEAHAYWPAQAVANFALGGRPAVDLAVAYIASPLFGSSGWDPEVCARNGVRPDQLPEVEAPGAPVGHLDGTPDGPVITAGAVDVWCEQLVAGATEPGDVHVMCGTTLIVWAVSPASGPAPHASLWSVPHSSPELRMVGGASNAGGLFLDWAGRAIRVPPRADRLDPANVPVWVPYLRGERTPYHDPSMRASLCGLDLTHGPRAIRQAALEASAFVVRHHLELAGVTARRLVATGGGTRVDGWMQALADGTGVPVHVASEPEGAARGAAFLARVAAGLETDVNQARRWAATSAVVEPRQEWVDPAAERYQRFLELSGSPDRPATEETTG